MFSDLNEAISISLNFILHCVCNSAANKFAKKLVVVVVNSPHSADRTNDLCCRLGGPLSSGLLVKGRMEWRRFCKCFGTSLSCPWRWLAARPWKTSTDLMCKPKPKGLPPECDESGFETTICRPSNCTIDLHRRPNDSSDCWTVRVYTQSDSWPRKFLGACRRWLFCLTKPLVV